MTARELFAGGGIAIVLLTLLEIAPIKINPWGALRSLCRSALGAVGGRINAGVMAELRALKATQVDIQDKLDKHIEMDGRRTANEYRAQILRFNNELLRDIRHTKEEYIDILNDIDSYEKYCSDHPEYPNNRALIAIETIKANYKDRLQKHDFLESFGGGSHEEA